MSNVKLITDNIVDKLEKKEITPQQAIEEVAKSMMTKRKYVPPTIDDVKQKYVTNLVLRDRALASTVPFIDPGVGSEFKLSQGLILVGGVTGQGKSTTSANLIAGFLNAEPKKKVLVITNEENTAAVYDRVACVLLKFNFKSYYAGKLSKSQTEEVRDLSRSLMNQITVEEGSIKYDMTCLEDVEAALVHASEGGYGLACLDYLQTVCHSSEDPNLEPVQVSKRLGFFLKDYSRKVEIPVIVFVQLKPQDAAPDFASRIMNDKTIMTHAFMAVEVVPEFDTQQSRFVFHKDRFGEAQGKEIVMEYVGGRFQPIEGSL